MRFCSSCFFHSRGEMVNDVGAASAQGQSPHWGH